MSTSGSSASTFPDAGMIPDAGPTPIGCQGKIDFLWVISSFYDMEPVQPQLQEVAPKFTAILESELADFDYHIMTIDAGTSALLPDCHWCYMCNCNGCEPWGGPVDYPCDEDKTLCDGTSGAGITITGNFGASNKRCDIVGDQRFLTSAEGTNLNESFACISSLGMGPKVTVAMLSLRDAITPDMLGPNGCNAGFLRDDALLVVVVLQGAFDTLSPDTPEVWYERLVALKGGNEDAVVVLSMSSDSDSGPGQNFCGFEPAGYENPLRTFANVARHGIFRSICEPDYTPIFEETAALVLQQCASFIPQ